MVNHGRNLLINVGPDGYSLATYPGEEYIPIGYKPKKLPPALMRFRQVLVGNNPDRVYLNYRVQQLLKIIHATPLGDYMSQLDPRITYLPFKDTFFSNVFGLSITQVTGNDERVYITGSHAANESTGKIEQLWDVFVLSGPQVRIIKRRAPYSTVVSDIDYTAGLSTPVQLPGSELSIRFQPSAAGTHWQLQSFAAPTTDIGSLLSLAIAAFGDQGDSEIFPTISSEPVTTFKRVWQSSDSGPLRFAALLLAYIWKVESLPVSTRVTVV